MSAPDPRTARLRIVEADLEDPAQQRAVVALTDAYASDRMGDGTPLADDARDRLIAGLRQHPTTLVFLAYAGDAAVGLATCFLGFSTFAARPLLNIHDLVVLPTHRGRGAARLLLEAAERKARAMGCCKLTLEVTEGNGTARGLYQGVGFRQAAYGEGGRLLVYAKHL